MSTSPGSSSRWSGAQPASLFSRTEHEQGETLLRVSDVTLPRLGGGFLLDHISLEVHAGEILGLYGLMGAGRSELMEVLAGVRPEADGEVWLDGRILGGASVADRIEAGVVLVPEDRKTDGLVEALSVAHNMVLASLRKYLQGFYLSRGRERSAVDQMIEDLSIRVASPNAVHHLAERWQPAEGGRGQGAADDSPRCCCSTNPRAVSTSAPSPRSSRS